MRTREPIRRLNGTFKNGQKRGDNAGAKERESERERKRKRKWGKQSEERVGDPGW